jgi:hypothetical protein
MMMVIMMMKMKIVILHVVSPMTPKEANEAATFTWAAPHSKPVPCI